MLTLHSEQREETNLCQRPFDAPHLTLREFPLILLLVRIHRGERVTVALLTYYTVYHLFLTLDGPQQPNHTITRLRPEIVLFVARIDPNPTLSFPPTHKPALPSPNPTQLTLDDLPVPQGELFESDAHYLCLGYFFADPSTQLQVYLPTFDRVSSSSSLLNPLCECEECGRKGRVLIAPLTLITGHGQIQGFPALTQLLPATSAMVHLFSAF